MINVSSWLENNSTKFVAKFTCQAKDVWVGDYKHPASGTTSRQGIWEGVKLVNVKYKDEHGVWRDNGANWETYVSAGHDGAVLECKATYEIWTMGYPGRSYPFLYFGNYSKNKKKYMKGYFTDAAPQWPDNVWGYAKVPTDWWQHYIGWSHPGGNSVNDHWCYKHAMIAGGETWKDNCYEYRNGTNGNGANGWTSESGSKPQETRRNCFFVFRKEFHTSITSSGIVLKPNIPSLEVYGAKGDSGQVKLTHWDPAGRGARVWLRAHCNGGHADIDNYNSSGHFGNGSSYTYTVDFNRAFGEGYRGHDVYYEAWVKNDAGFESDSTGRKGTQRYNGRPSIPGGLKVAGRNNRYYDWLTVSWDKAWDPDGDNVVYDIWARIITPNGSWIHDAIISIGQSNMHYDYDMSHLPDNTKIGWWVRSSDNLITSGWSNEVWITKGEAAKPADSLYPINNTTLYNKRPRILIGKGSNANNTVVVNWAGTWFDNKTHSHLFSRNDSSNTIVFKPDRDMSIGENTIKVKLRNEYADSSENSVKFNIAENINKDNYKILNLGDINKLRANINNLRKAYGFKEYKFKDIAKDVIVDNEHYNEYIESLKEVNDFINSFDSNNSFDIGLELNTVKDYDYITKEQWVNIINKLEQI